MTEFRCSCGAIMTDTNPLNPPQEVLLFHILAKHEVVMSEPTTERVAVTDVQLDERLRTAYGNTQSLAASIKKFGIIQPIILTRVASQGDGGSGADSIKLIAGGRRFEAVKTLGRTHLEHGRDFVWRDEESTLQRKAVELEENLRREDLKWFEVVLAKKQLFDLMVSEHGANQGGRRAHVGKDTGFSIRMLAEMLDESPSTTSNDLQVAEMLVKFPSLAKLPTKQDALRRLNVAVTVVAMSQSASPLTVSGPPPTLAAPGGIPMPSTVTIPTTEWLLYKGDFRANINNVADSSIDLVATDLPYSIGLGDSTASHGAGLGGFTDRNLDIVGLCTDVAIEAWRVLKDNRYAVLFFGFNYYKELRDALESVGFSVDDYPFIWKRDRTAPPSPARYAKCYDPALICQKGNPTLLRPNIGNFADIPSVRGGDRLHNAQKPIAVMERFVLDMTAPGSTVLDFCAGAGTTGVAAVRNKRKAILFELEEANCSIIEARMKALK